MPHLQILSEFIVWVFIVFFLVHLYVAVLDDVEEQDGVLSSIVNGVEWSICPEMDEEAAKRRTRNG